MLYEWWINSLLMLNLLAWSYYKVLPMIFRKYEWESMHNQVNKSCFSPVNVQLITNKLFLHLLYKN